MYMTDHELNVPQLKSLKAEDHTWNLTYGFFLYSNTFLKNTKTRTSNNWKASK